MAIRHKNVSIRKNELTTLKVTVAEWEVPLLHIVHGEGAVQELDGEPWADVEPPNTLDEYRRLESKYRVQINDDGSPGQSVVSAVYGPFGASPLLRQAIQAAVFERPRDLLGIEALEKTAVDAEAVAKAAREKVDAAKVAAGDATAPAEGAKVPAKKPSAKTPKSLL